MNELEIILAGLLAISEYLGLSNKYKVKSIIGFILPIIRLFKRKKED